MPYGKTTKIKKVYVYCPKCSAQNLKEKAQLGTTVICKKCGHYFIAEIPKIEIFSKSTRKKILSWFICAFVFVLVGNVAKKMVKEYYVMEKATADANKQHDYDLIRECIDEYSIRFREYGRTVRETLDIYCSSTGDELMGRKDPNKYRQAIEQSLREAKSLHNWCDQKLKTFNPDMYTTDGKKFKVIVRKAYASYYELSDIGIKLFSKTLKCHQLHCGMRSDASSQDRDIAIAFMKNNRYFVDDLVKMDEEVMQIAQKYSSVEEDKFNNFKREMTTLEQSLK